MTDEDIKDQIRKSTDSAIQALTVIVREIQHENSKHRDEEIVSREAYRKELKEEVRHEMKVNFNGKMDTVMKKLDTLIEQTAPVIQQYENTKGFWKTMGDNTKKVGIIGALFAGLIAIFTYLTKLSQ